MEHSGSYKDATDETSRKTFAVRNPATGLAIESYALMDRKDVDRFVAQAHLRFESWSQTSFSERKKILIRASQCLADNAGKYAEQIALENGKTKLDALLADVFTSVDLIKYLAGHAEKFL